MSEKTRRKKDGGDAGKQNKEQREADNNPGLKDEKARGDDGKTEMTDEQRAAQSTQTKRAMRD